MLRTSAPCPQKCSPVIYSTVVFVPPHIPRRARTMTDTVYEVRTMRLPRVLVWCYSLTIMSTFYHYQHQRYAM